MPSLAEEVVALSKEIGPLVGRTVILELGDLSVGLTTTTTVLCDSWQVACFLWAHFIFCRMRRLH